MSIENIITEVEKRLMQFAGLGYKVKFVFDEGGVLLLDGTTMPPSVTEEDAEADCVINISEDNALKLMNGQLNSMMAYTLGNLKISGSVGVAQKMASMLDN